MFRNALHLTALMLARTVNPRGEGEPNAEPPKKTREEWAAERAVAHASSSHAELSKKVADLEFDLRETRGKVPKEGTRQLTAEEASEFDALTLLGRSSELKTRLEAGDTATAGLSARARGDLLREVSEATGTNLKALTRLAGELQFEVGQETEADGKKSRPVTVKDGDKAKSFSEYLKDEWADVAPALVVTGTQQQGVEFTRQDSGAGAGTGGSWVQTAIKAGQAASAYVDPLQIQSTTGAK